MGQKVHPTGFRLGLSKAWVSKWYAEHNFGTLLREDLQLRKHLKKKLYQAGISRIEIERAGQKIRVIIHTARPGIIIGKKGAEVEKLRKDIELYTGKQAAVDIKEIRAQG